MSQQPAGAAVSPPIFSIVNGYPQYSIDNGQTWTIAVVAARAGSNLGNADATVNPATDAASLYSLPAGTLTADRVLTLGTGGSPATNLVAQVIRRDTSAHALTVKDDAGTTLFTFAASPTSAQGASFYFNGTHFALLSSYFVA